MANQIADAIRRIVGFDPTRDPLAPGGEKGQILGSTGIGYLYPDQSSVGKSNTGGTSPVNNAPADDKIITPDTGKPAYQTGGNRVDSKDPSQAIHTVNDGVYTASEVITPTTDKTITLKDTKKYESGLGGLTDAASGGGTLNGLTDIYDCDDGTAIDIRLDGYFVPPAGWENAETPPPPNPDDVWVQGFAWGATMGSNPIKYANKSGAMAYAQATAEATFGFDPDDMELSYMAFEDAPPQFLEGASTFQVRVKRISTGDIFFFGVIGLQDCSNPFYGSAYCPTEDPTPPPKWPADGKMQLIRTPEGTLVASPYEPEEDMSWNYADGQQSTINFCFEGDRKGVLEPTNDGGYMIYETVAGFGQGIYKIFGMNNRVIGYTDAAGAEAYRPLPPNPTTP